MFETPFLGKGKASIPVDSVDEVEKQATRGCLLEVGVGGLEELHH